MPTCRTRTPTVCLTLLWRPRPQKPKAPKVLPPDAVSRHPVMLLHEMRTSVVFEMTEYNKPTAVGQEHSYTMTVTVDGREFKATGGCRTDTAGGGATGGCEGDWPVAGQKPLVLRCFLDRHHGGRAPL